MSCSRRPAWERPGLKRLTRPGEKVVFKDTDEAFREASEERFWLCDPTTPKWWGHVLGNFRLGETAELTMDAQVRHAG